MRNDPILETKYGRVAFRRWGEYSSSMFGTESMGKTAERLGVDVVLLLSDENDGVPSVKDVEELLAMMKDNKEQHKE